MEKLVERGLVRAIGVSNFTERKLFNFLEDIKTKPAVHQGKVHVCVGFVLYENHKPSCLLTICSILLSCALTISRALLKSEQYVLLYFVYKPHILV